MQEPFGATKRDDQPYASWVDGRPAEKQCSQWPEHLGCFARQLIEQVSGKKQGGDLFLLQQRRELLRGEQHIFRNTNKTSTVKQCAPNLECGCVEGGVRGLCHAIG